MSYKEGQVTLPTGQSKSSGEVLLECIRTSDICVAIPKPYDLYPQHFQNALLPLLLCFTFAWAFEMYVYKLISMSGYSLF